MLPQELIRRKRDGGELRPAEIDAFVTGLTDGSMSESQVAALAMAIFLRGMSRVETVALTQAMTRSGVVLEWPKSVASGATAAGFEGAEGFDRFDRPVLDKHSTGGVGDKVSLMLAPIVAACGGAVPMISGRGLGHTGGTLDKLESIPGYDATPDRTRFQRIVREVGCAIVGQTAEIAPADRRLYAIRDVTATVESIPLITASILSKKLAAGLSGLVMDVKTGSGAFMASEDGARELARTIVEVAGGAGLPTRALITDMNEVLGSTAGNALEVREAIAYLCAGAREARLDDVTIALAAELLLIGGLAPSAAEAAEACRRSIESGAAAETFARMVAALGGPADLLEHPDRHLPTAPVVRAVAASRAGFVSAVDTRAIGLAIVELGGGRRRVEDAVDHAVGLTEIAPIGTDVGPEARPLCLVHARTLEAAEAATEAIRAAVTLADVASPSRPVIVDRLG